MLRQKNINLSEISSRSQEFLLQITGVRNVYTANQLLTSDSYLLESIRNGFNIEKCGDLIVDIAPGWKLINENTQEKSMSRSAHVPFPIIIYGAGTKAERIQTPVTVDRIAPAVARAIRIRAPNACVIKDMNLTKILTKLFGNKSSRDMKLIQPLVEKVKAVYPEIQQLDNDQLRQRTKDIQQKVQQSAKTQKEEIERLKGTIEDTPIDERAEIFAQIDKLEKEALEIYEVALNEVMPEVFSIVKETARRFAENEETVVTATDFDRELAGDPKKDFITIDGDKAIYHNHWTAGGNDLKWEMVHYDVQLFGGVVLHQGKIAEMATGEGKTLVATLPVFLNALTGNGVHVVTVNDYLAKRDSEWMGPLYMFHGLSVDCIDKHQPNSEARRRAYQCDITFGTNNEFGFDYLRDNMAISPQDLVQRAHNYAIVDEVDSVLIDDARTPLIISGPVPKGDDQMFEEYQPLVERLVGVQRQLATQYLAEAKQKIAEGREKNDKKLEEEGFLALYRSHKSLPKNKPLIKFLSEEGIKSGMQATENVYMENNNRRMPEAIEPLYFVVDEKLNSCDLTDKGTAWLAKTTLCP